MGEKGAKILSHEEAHRIRTLYMELNVRGRRKYVMMDLAEMFGVGETTIYRVIRGTGPYRDLPEAKTELEMRKAAAESEKRLMELLNSPAVEAPKGPSAIEVFMQAGREREPDPPASPLDGGEGAGAEPDTVARLEKDIAVRDPNKLLKELEDGE